MARNSSLHAAKTSRQDEFYTKYQDIQAELDHYKEHFEGKTVLCNCDDPFESNFCKFFLKNFHGYKLKRLVCTGCGTRPGTQGKGYVLDVADVLAEVRAGGTDITDSGIGRLLYGGTVHELEGNGDFRSAECIEYLKQADIVVSNPPFSLFREYASRLTGYGKEFLIIGPQNAIPYKEFFPLLKDNRVWLGCTAGSRDYLVPHGYGTGDAGVHMDRDGRMVKSMGNTAWFTNLDHAKRHEPLALAGHYYGQEEDYQRYDNYDCINVDRVKDIPGDYFPTGGYAAEIYEGRGDLEAAQCAREAAGGAEGCNGIMGVPITFLDRYCPEQFEIVGSAYGNSRKNKFYGEVAYTQHPDDRGGCGIIDGKRKYGRIFIRAKI